MVPVQDCTGSSFWELWLAAKPYIVVSSLLRTVWPHDVCDVAVPCGLARPRWKVRRESVPLGAETQAGVNVAKLLLRLWVGMLQVNLWVLERTW